MRFKFFALFGLVVAGTLLPATGAVAQQPSIPAFTFIREADSPREVGLSLQIMALLTVLSLGPSVLIMTTCFTRIMVVLSFLRQALGTRTLPPTQLLAGLSLFLTMFTMMPVWRVMYDDALQPYFQGTLSQDKAFTQAVAPVRAFMLRQTREKDLALFIGIAQQTPPQEPADIPTSVLIPAFIISELKTAFIMGFILFIPFLIIDMIVASVIMSMGMMMLPPAMISMPFKLLMFVLIDGWHLLIKSLLGSIS